MKKKEVEMTTEMTEGMSQEDLQELNELQIDSESIINLDDNSIYNLLSLKDFRKAVELDTESIKNVSREDLKMIVNLYYQIQHLRIQISNQCTANEGSVMTHNLLLLNAKEFEANCKKIIDLYVGSSEVGKWLTDIKGIGPVLAGGLLAMLDVTKAPYATNFISYAGLNDNNRPWIGNKKSTEIVNGVVGDSKIITDDMVAEIARKSQWKFDYLLENAYDEKKGKWNKDSLIKTCSKIPYNKDLKTHMYKIGELFIKNANRGSLYGRLYLERKALENEKNENGDYADQAAYILSTKNFKDNNTKKIYESGKLPPAHIIKRSMRYAEKIFLSHVFEEMYRVEYNKLPPRYYSLEHLEGHHKNIEPEVPYTEITGGDMQ